MQLHYSKLKKLPVETQSGILLGRVCDLSIEIDGHSISKYIVVKSKFFATSSELLIAPEQIVKITGEKVIVEDNVEASQIRHAMKQPERAPMEEAASVCKREA